MTDFLIKSTIAMGVLLGLYYILFEKEKMHRFNRFYLLSALLFSLALPFVTIPVYVEAEVAPQPISLEQGLEFRENIIPIDNTISDGHKIKSAPSAQQILKPSLNYWPYLGWGLYILIVLILSIRFALNILHFYKTKRNNLTVSYKGTSLVLLNDNVLPHTFLGNIYVSKEEYDNKLIAAELFTHELAHVKQFHTLDIIFIEVLKTIFWFNPLLYFYKKAIQLNHEFLADEKVIDSTANTICYQNLLLERANVGKAFSLASNLNFSLTKKRFIMMTKTTNRTKALLLKFAILPASACLIYFLSTETVAFTKSADNTIPEMTIIPESVITMAGETTASQKDSTKQSAVTKTTVSDPEARKNEYYKGVRIIIEDAQRGKYIDLPYENLTSEDRKYYLPDARDKRKANGISDDDYKFSLHTLYEEDQSIGYFIDDIKVTRAEVLKHKKEDFAAYAAKFSGVRLVNGKPKGNHRSFFYTYPYFEKNLKNINDHYPDKTLRIAITQKPENQYISEFAAEAKATGKTELQISEEREKKELEAVTYNTVAEIKENNRLLPSKFTGEDGDFDKYISKNLKIDDKLNGKQLIIMFTINTDGTISDIRAGGLAPEVEAEVQRVFKNSPRWIPAQDGKKPQQTTSLITLPLKK